MTRKTNDVLANAAAIAQTQQDIAATFAALQDRLTPAHMLADTGHALANGARATSGQATQSVRDLVVALQQQVHDAPMVAAILGAAVAWLTTQAQRTEDLGQATATHAQAAAQHLTAQAQQHAEDLAGAVRQQAGATLEQAQEQIRGDMMHLEQLIGQHPWLVSALAVALGLGIGAALPGTAQEQKWYHEASASLGHQVSGLVHDTLQALHPPAETPA